MSDRTSRVTIPLFFCPSLFLSFIFDMLLLSRYRPIRVNNLLHHLSMYQLRVYIVLEIRLLRYSGVRMPGLFT